MKKSVAGFLFIMMILFPLFNFAFVPAPEEIEDPAGKSGANLFLGLFLSQSKTSNVINWNLGDYSEYVLDLGFFGKGSIQKKATKEDNNNTAIWITTMAKTPLMNQKIETLISRATGKILKLLVDGQEQPYKDHELELISKEPSEITLSIENEQGEKEKKTFRVIHIKVKDKTDDAAIETWINPKDITLDGTAKTILKKSFLTTTLELTKYGYGKKPELAEIQHFNHLFMHQTIGGHDFSTIDSGGSAVVEADFSPSFLNQ